MNEGGWNAGSYKGYYKRNNDVSCRLEGIDKSFFRGKSCLDIGCNEGKVTIKIAEDYLPARIVGVDVDRRLIDAAESAVKRAKHAASALAFQIKSDTVENQTTPPLAPTKVTTLPPDTSSAILSTVPAIKVVSTARFSQFVPRAVAAKKAASATATATATATPSTSAPVPTTVVVPLVPGSFPSNVSFRCMDFRAMSLCPENRFDSILCLSVTKWIHLNDGDRGLLLFFQKAFQHLRPGGAFILEYQHWKSYEKNKNGSEHIKAMFKTLLLRPHHFEQLLQEEMGFTVLSRLGTPLAQAKGFNRPILVLQRPLATGAAAKAAGKVESEEGQLLAIVNKYASIGECNSAEEQEDTLSSNKISSIEVSDAEVDEESQERKRAEGRDKKKKSKRCKEEMEHHHNEGKGQQDEASIVEEQDRDVDEKKKKKRKKHSA